MCMNFKKKSSTEVFVIVENTCKNIEPLFKAYFTVIALINISHFESIIRKFEPFFSHFATVSLIKER